MLPKPLKDAMIFEDKLLYACLATHPITKGHVIVAWKKPVSDLHLLTRTDYEHLMNTVEKVRNAMLKVLGVEKVYLIYMDEVKHVHWHLVPRYNEKGFNMLTHEPKQLHDFSLVEKLKAAL